MPRRRFARRVRPMTGDSGTAGDGRTAGEAISLVEIVTSLAGTVALLYAVGAVVIAGRLKALDLPVDASVAALPKSTLLVFGFRAAFVGALLAAVLLATSHAADAPTSGRRLGMLFTIGVLALVAVEAVFAASATTERLATGGIGLVAFVVAALLVKWSRVPPPVVLAIVLVAASVAVRVATEVIPPTELNLVSVRLKDGGATDGYYLASDSGALYLAPNVLDRTVGVVTTIPRSEIKGYTIEEGDDSLARSPNDPAPDGFDDVRKVQYEDLFDYVADVRTDAGWVYPPVLPVDSLQFVLDEYDGFAPGDVHVPGPHDGTRVALRDVLIDPQLYTGRALVVRGLVTRVAPTGSPRPGDANRIVVFRPADERDTEASCESTMHNDVQLRADDAVEARVVVLAWGLSPPEPATQPTSWHWRAHT